jgi:hypothetical protein
MKKRNCLQSGMEQHLSSAKTFNEKVPVRRELGSWQRPLLTETRFVPRTQTTLTRSRVVSVAELLMFVHPRRKPDVINLPIYRTTRACFGYHFKGDGAIYCQSAFRLRVQVVPMQLLLCGLPSRIAARLGRRTKNGTQRHRQLLVTVGASA